MSLSNNSNRRLVAAVAGLVLAAVAAADRVDLGDDYRLSGSVTAIDGDGRVTIETDLSPEPLVIQPDSVAGVSFAARDVEGIPRADQEIHLRNGDVIPCRIKSMNGDAIQVASWFAGELEVPRRHVAAMHFGVSEPAMILDRRAAMLGWTKSAVWKVLPEEQSLASSGSGKIMRRLESGLPGRFIIRFRYEWKGNPRMRLYFADAELPEEGVADRYILTINSAGIEVKRQTANKRPNITLKKDDRRPVDLWPDGMDIELRVDRNLPDPLFHLLVNGDLVDRFVDPIGSPPAGDGLILESSAGTTSKDVVRNLEIIEWNDGSTTRVGRGTSDPGQDALHDREGEHFSGQAEAITEQGGRPVIVFRHPDAGEPLRVPLEQAASLWFRVAEGDVDRGDGLILGLSGDGSLRVESCRLDERRAECVHPLLGKLSIDRRAVRSLRNDEKSDES